MSDGPDIPEDAIRYVVSLSMMPFGPAFDAEVTRIREELEDACYFIKPAGQLRLPFLTVWGDENTPTEANKVHGVDGVAIDVPVEDA
jgi:hypothetical protein